MYLFVFVFLTVSIMGLYTELFAIRASLISDEQKGIAETMIVWHGAEHEFMNDFVAKAKYFDPSCSLTSGYTAQGGINTCREDVAGGNLYQLPPYAVSPIYGNANYLPKGYDYVNLKWNTIHYKLLGTRYILTFLPSDEKKLGYSADQIYQQLTRTDLPKISYGRVSTSCPGEAASGSFLVTNENLNKIPVCYTLPADPAIAEGSIGIISNLGQ